MTNIIEMIRNIKKFTRKLEPTESRTEIGSDLKYISGWVGDEGFTIVAPKSTTVESIKDQLNKGEYTEY